MAKQPAAIGLSAGMASFYRAVSRRYPLSEHHRKLLVCACQAHTRMEEAQALIASAGLTVTDRHGQTRPHPAVLIEAQSRIAFARLLRELGLQDEAPDESRPPRLTGRYAGRK